MLDGAPHNGALYRNCANVPGQWRKFCACDVSIYR